MITQKSAVLDSLPASQNGFNGVRLVNPDYPEIQRELGLFARYKCDALQLAAYLVKQFRVLVPPGLADDRVQRLARDLSECCSWTWFKQHPTKERSKLYRADFCNHRLLCINCSRRNSFVMLGRYWSRILALMESTPGARPYSLTLTMPNTADLVGGIHLLRCSLVKLFNRARKKNTGPMRHVLGAVVCYEVTRGKDGKWHPHLHCIVMLAPGQRIDVCELRQEWSALTGGRQIRIDALTKQKDLLEVFKYTLKVGADGLSLADRALAYFLLAGTRLRESYGCFRGIPDSMDLAEGEQEEISTWLDVFFRWAGAGYRRVSSLRLE